MIITESELREMWRDGRNPLPAFPPGTRFTPAALDFLKAHRLEVRWEDRVPPPDPAPQPPPQASPQPAPDARLRLHARLDTLHACVRLAAAEARRYQLPRLAEQLDGLAAYCREIQQAGQGGRPPGALSVAGRPQAGLAEIAQEPERAGLAHLAPGAEDHAILHWLNLVRAMAREAAVEARLALPPGGVEEPALAGALDHLSSAAYRLQLMVKAGQLGWNVGG